MQCLKARELLSPWYDGMLSAGEEKALISHLAACPACREEERALKEALVYLKSLPDVVPPVNFAAGVIEKVRSLPGSSRKPAGLTEKAGSCLRRLARGRWSPLVAAAATFVLAAGITYYTYGPPANWGRPGLPGGPDGQPGTAVVAGELGSSKVGLSSGDLSGGASEGTSYGAGSAGSEGPDAVPVQEGAGSGAVLPGAGTGEGGWLTPKEERLLSLLAEQAYGAGGSAPPAASAPRTVAVKEGVISQQVAYGYLPVASKEGSRLVRSARLTLKPAVEWSKACEDIAGAAAACGGYTMSKSDSSITVKVPAEKFKEVVDSIQAMGSYVLRQISAVDATDKYLACEEKIKELLAEEQSLKAVADGPEASRDVLLRLAEVQGELDKQKKLLASLAENVETATIRVDLE